ncbi:MAG: hypothetical protein HFF11_03465 [Angelakisella sp.]|nr:hypothetical protein [Angelakisella sp.]
MSLLLPELYPQERPVELWANGELLCTLYCTPQDLEDLALGHLMGRGLLDPGSPPAVAAVPGDPWRLETTLSLPGKPGRDPALSRWTTTLSQVVELAETAMEHTPLRKKGGVHAAALGWEGGFLVREDVARHNAVDKVVGAGIIKGVDFSVAALFTTGRLSHEMVLKAAGAGVPVAVSMKYPSDLGAALAAQRKICVIGKVLSGAPVVYTNGWRVAQNRQ